MIRSLWAPPCVWSLFILFLTSIPNPNLPAPKGSDTWAHFLVYAVLGVLTARAAELTPRRVLPLLAVIAGVSLFGAFDEWHQAFIPGRVPGFADWIADSVGGAVGAMLFTFAMRRRQVA